MTKIKEPRKKHPEVCGLGGCFNAKIGAGLFCAKHWRYVSPEVQKRYTDAILDGSRTPEQKCAEINAIELLALGDIGQALEKEKAAQKAS